MPAKSGNGALIFGVLLIAIGMLFLLQEWISLSWVWSVLATWWPLLLIAIGLRKIVRYFGYGTR